MFKLEIKPTELYDEGTQTFLNIAGQTLTLEHSLISLSEWESKWHIPFLGRDTKTLEQIVDYVRCMTITRNVDPNVYKCITPDQYSEIEKYINDPMTATWFNDKTNRKYSREIITNELIYYWMVDLEIPFTCEKWHLNRLLTLIRVCNAKNAPGKKMSKKDIMNQNRALNAARRARTGSSG